MIELLAIFATSFIIGFSGALMPGPVLTVTIDHASRGGFYRGVQVSIGHAFLEFFIVVLLILGLSEALKAGFVIGSTGVLGGVFLFWMGYKIMKDARGWGVNGYMRGEDRSHRVNPFISGILTSLFNPYWLIWWATIGSAYILLSATHGAAGIILFYVGHILSDIVWYSFVSATISKGRERISGGVFKGILWLCGLLLLLFASYFLYYGLSSLLYRG